MAFKTGSVRIPQSVNIKVTFINNTYTSLSPTPKLLTSSLVLQGADLYLGELPECTWSVCAFPMHVPLASEGQQSSSVCSVKPSCSAQCCCSFSYTRLTWLNLKDNTDLLGKKRKQSPSDLTS